MAASTLALSSFPAAAQVTVEASVQSDLRDRGYSRSGERPVASVSLGYDDPSGFYLGAAAHGTVREGEPALVGIQGSFGYAVRLSPGLSLDAGLARSEYQASFTGGRDYHYTEAYLGLTTRNFSARAFYSPDYYWPDMSTLYVQLDGGLEITPSWRANAHIGTLNYLDRPPSFVERHQFDWRFGLSRQLGDYGLHLDLSGRLKGGSYYVRGRKYEKAAVVVGISRAF